MYFLFNDLRVRQGFDPDMIFGSEPIWSHILITNSTSRLGFWFLNFVRFQFLGFRFDVDKFI